MVLIPKGVKRLEDKKIDFNHVWGHLLIGEASFLIDKGDGQLDKTKLKYKIGANRKSERSENRSGKSSASFFDSLQA
jgi:hypothetical protein